jgi:hypothetical protein
VGVPGADQGIAYRDPLPEKPLPPQGPDDLPAPAFNDPPLISEHLPEQRAFVDAYRRVGRPRILVFVNRSLEGEILPVNGPPLHRDDAYLQPGQYDEASAKSIDYQAMETVLTDWLSANGQVQIVSPVMSRQRLTDEQYKDLQSGRPRMLGEVARQLDADVLVEAQAHPTRQTPEGLQIRLVAEAINVKGGESIARALVDISPPLDRPQINKFTRFLARKLMDGMMGSWDAPGPAQSGANPPEQRPLPPADRSAPSAVPPVNRLPGPANTPVLPVPTTRPVDVPPAP